MPDAPATSRPLRVTKEVAREDHPCMNSVRRQEQLFNCAVELYPRISCSGHSRPPTWNASAIMFMHAVTRDAVAANEAAASWRG